MEVENSFANAIGFIPGLLTKHIQVIMTTLWMQAKKWYKPLAQRENCLVPGYWNLNFLCMLPVHKEKNKGLSCMISGLVWVFFACFAQKAQPVKITLICIVFFLSFFNNITRF